MPTVPTITAKIEQATLLDAEAYAATTEKFIFCVDFLEISAHGRLADRLVNQLEDKFDALLDSRAEDTENGEDASHPGASEHTWRG